MLTACIVLLLLGALGAFDIAYFHWHVCKLGSRHESRVEMSLHVARGFLYALQFVLVPNVVFRGWWYAAFVALFAVDAVVAWADVVCEPASRRSQGGLPTGEYFMHIVLSVLVGVMLHALAVATIPWAHEPTGLAWAPSAPSGLRIVLGLMALASGGVACLELLELVDRALPRPVPVHVSVRLRTRLARLWETTQDHVLHPTWDHRFSRIVMLDETIRTGTEMLYEKRVFGLMIRGFGRYKLHKPMRQSSFEFWSNHPMSLIRRGVGLWLYTPLEDGRVEFSTSYTYDVRWGAVGRWVDRLVFRPLIQGETERSFRRLAATYFPDGASPVLGAEGRKPARLLFPSPTPVC